MNIRKALKRFIIILYCVLSVMAFSGCGPHYVPENPVNVTAPETSGTLDEEGIYNSKEDVALYIHTYGHLPQNYITKKEARKLGWKSGGLDSYAYGKCLGGDRFKNREGALPEKKGRTYYECDLDTLHKKERGKKRLIYSDDGLIYFTDTHYSEFELLYGEP